MWLVKSGGISSLCKLAAVRAGTLSCYVNLCFIFIFICIFSKHLLSSLQWLPRKRGAGGLFHFSASICCSFSPCPFPGTAGDARMPSRGGLGTAVRAGCMLCSSHLLLKAVSQMARPLPPRVQPLEHLNSAPCQCHCVC